VRKSWFQKNGTVNWNDIQYVTVTMRANSNASSTNPAKICIDNVRLLKTPPMATPFKIQLAGCERQECGSTTGWLKDVGGGTPCDFNTQFAREGIHCVKVTARASDAGTATASLEFTPAKDLSIFPDNSNATASDVLKLNCSWPGQGFLTDWDLSVLSSPKIQFIDGTVSGANSRTVAFGIVENLIGGGTGTQLSFNPENTGTTAYGTAWTGVGATFDWTNVKYIKMFGPYIDPGTWSGETASPII
jgi:hypothetical protein